MYDVFVPTLSVVYDNEVANQEHFYDSVDEIKTTIDEHKTTIECEFGDVVLHNDAICDEKADGDVECSTDAKITPSSHRVQSSSDDSAYVIENLQFTDTEQTNSPSTADDATRKTAVDEEKNQIPRSPDLVAINIPFDDSGVPTIVEDQESVLVIENPLLQAPVCDTQDDKQPATLDDESHVTTISEETIKTNRPIENLCTNAISASSPSPVVSSDNTIKLPATSQNVAPRSSYMVAISIPCDDSSIPMAVESEVTCDLGTSASHDETVKIQRNPAYDVISDKSTIDNSDETVEIQRNPAYTGISCASSEVNFYEVISHTTVSTTSTNNTATTSVKMQRNPAYATVNHHCRSTQQNN